MSALTVTPLAGSMGAEVGGLDLSKPISEAALDDLRSAWLAHLVIVFRDQPLSVDAFFDFAGAIGDPVEYPFVPGLDGYPTVIEVTKLAHETVNFGGIWHADTTYLEEPPMGTMLLAREVPPAGGDTEFANQYAAFDALSPAMQEMLSPLRAVSTSSMADVSATREDRRRDAAESGFDAEEETYEAVHPVVRTHPETGKRSLFVNVAHTARFDGMTEEESKPLLRYLFAHQVRAEFTFRLGWSEGTIALWDNRCVLHNPINDYDGHRRVMHRITLAGDAPV